MKSSYIATHRLYWSHLSDECLTGGGHEVVKRLIHNFTRLLHTISDFRFIAKNDAVNCMRSGDRYPVR